MQTRVQDSSIPESVADFLQLVADEEHVDAIVLFGSRAVGDHTERSDVDIAICSELISPLRWARLRQAAEEFPCLYPMTFVHFETNPPALQRRIIETGKLIYVAEKASRRIRELGKGGWEP